MSISDVNFKRMVSIENGPLAILDPEMWGKSFTKAIQIVILNLGADLYVVIAIHYIHIISWEDSTVIDFPRNPEVKWI